MPAPNPTGRNQHSAVLSEAARWVPIIQSYLDEGVKVKDLSARIYEEHHTSISTRSIQRMMNKYEIRNAHRPRLSISQMIEAVVRITTEDPLNEWGIRRIQEELKLESIHVPRTLIQNLQSLRDPEEAKRRRSGHRKIVRRALFSAGPNEEWCMDGHEKLRDAMGIDVWGICDKYSRYELGLWAVPNARQSQVPIALFLRVVKEVKGLPLQLTGDKGSENGKVGILQTVLRRHHAPSLSVTMLPPIRFVQSVRNITRERGWRPLWEKDLKNILDAWTTGQIRVNYHDGDRIHKELGTWLWAKVVQARLDRARKRQVVHRIRLQRRVLLPTGGTAHQFYHNPRKTRGTNMLIKVPDLSIIDNLIQEFKADEYLRFGDEISNELYEALFVKLGSPKLSLRNAWTVWRRMMNLLEVEMNK